MKKVLLTILLLVFALASCKENESASNSNSFNLSGDDTEEVIRLLTEANKELKQVKELYRVNQQRVDDELMPAMKNKEIDKAKAIADDFVFQINDGLVLGGQAVAKIKEAENKNINDTYKTYLRLKRESLEKYIEAFLLRHKVAQILRDGFGGKDPGQITKAQAEFKEKELRFHNLIQEGKDLSLEANQVFKDSLTKK